MANVLDELRRRMEASEHSRYRLSQSSGVAQSQLSRFARGIEVLKMHNAERLARALGYDIVLRKRKGR